MARGVKTVKVLRIGVVREGRIVEERLISRGESVTVGPAPSATFQLPPAETVEPITLFSWDGRGYQLNLNPRVGGKLSRGGEVMDLDALRGEIPPRGGRASFPLTPEVRGKVGLGSTTFLFQLVDEPGAAAASSQGSFSLLRALDRVLVAVLLLSFFGHSSFVCYVWGMEAPPEPTFEDLDRWVKHIPQRPKPPPVATIDEAEPAKVAPTEDPSPRVAPEAQAADDPEVKEARARERVADRLRWLGTRGRTGGLGGAAATAMDAASSGLDDLLASGQPLVTERRLHTSLEPGIEVQEATGPHIGGKDPIKVAERIKKGPEVALKPTIDRVGELDDAAIQRALAAYQGAMSACHTRALNRDPGVHGRLVLQIRVAPTGEVLGVEIAENGTFSTVLEDCLRSKILRWRFPTFSGDEASFSIPLVFSAP